MRCIDVDKFVKEVKEATDDVFLTDLDGEITEQDYRDYYIFWKGANTIIEVLKTSEDIFEVNEIAKDIIHPRGCDDDENLCCSDCEHQRSVQWCARAIKDREDVDPVYEEGWMDGIESAVKNLDGYDSGYADGWDDGWTECLEAIKIAMNKVFEDNK